MSETWDINSNCYGYAVKIRACGLARPGGVTRDADDTDEGYSERLKQGVLDDGGNRVAFNPAMWPNIPASAGGRNYLIALIVGANGFHFLRRESSRVIGPKRWKWKQGCQDNQVVTKVFHGGNIVRITNANLKTFISNPGAFTPSNGMPKPFIKVLFFDVHPRGFRRGSLRV